MEMLESFPIMQKNIPPSDKTAAALFGCFAELCLPVFPWRNSKSLPECPVESGMIPIANLLANGFQRQTLQDQRPGLFHPAVCNKTMEGGLGLLLKQLRHRGYADTELICDHLQGDLLRQIGFHIGCDLLQQRFLFQGRSQAFFAGLNCLVRRISLLCERVWTTKVSVNCPVYAIGPKITYCVKKTFETGPLTGTSEKWAAACRRPLRINSGKITEP